jgi:lycopene cyclase domain-containing protein
VKYEYLIFNIVVLAGPLVLATMRRFYFIDRWSYALPAIIITAIPFIIWDILVTGRHWMFSEAYTLNFRLANLPLEEWLFFLTVPFACLFTWEMILKYLPDGHTDSGKIVRYLSFLFPIAGLIFFYDGREYSGLVMFFLTLAVYLDKVLETNLVYKRHFYWYLLLIIVFTLLFNGFLTARPVVLYNEAYQVDLRVITIPIEDFGFGTSLIVLCTIIYESLKQKYILKWS